ncbi:MAG: hypothetical protein M3R24_42470 [Chloroflexota bacterium]|nr:hypothetical protein [Chloroflexota bacterium]
MTTPRPRRQLSALIHLHQEKLAQAARALREGRPADGPAPICVKRTRHGKTEAYCRAVRVTGAGMIVYDPINRLPCGAQVWVDTPSAYEVFERASVAPDRPAPGVTYILVDRHTMRQNAKDMPSGMALHDLKHVLRVYQDGVLSTAHQIALHGAFAVIFCPAAPLMLELETTESHSVWIETSAAITLQHFNEEASI